MGPQVGVEGGEVHGGAHGRAAVRALEWRAGVRELPHQLRALLRVQLVPKHDRAAARL